METSGASFSSSPQDLRVEAGLYEASICTSAFSAGPVSYSKVSAQQLQLHHPNCMFWCSLDPLVCSWWGLSAM